MPVLPVVLFLLVVLAGSLPAFPKTCCYPATFQPSPPYASSGCVCYVLGDAGLRLGFVYDPSDPYFDDDLSFCTSLFGSCEDLSFSCRVSSDGSISCSSSSSSEDSPIPSDFSCSSFPCFPDFPVGGSGSGSACQSVNDLIDTFQGVKEGFLKVFISSSFAFGLLGVPMRFLGLFFSLLAFAFAQSQCECLDYVNALNQLNQTIQEFKSDFLKMVLGLSTVLGTFSAILLGKALKRSAK
jgi:hypothetical protein